MCQQGRRVALMPTERVLSLSSVVIPMIKHEDLQKKLNNSMDKIKKKFLNYLAEPEMSKEHKEEMTDAVDKALRK